MQNFKGVSLAVLELLAFNTHKIYVSGDTVDKVIAVIKGCRFGPTLYYYYIAAAIKVKVEHLL